MSASTVSRGSPARTAGADIIDLDRYIRASVRPSRHRPVHTRERLIVDAGGVDRIPVELSSSSDSSPLETRTYTREHCKQYSHDSGLSDGSYLRQRYRPQRRINLEKPRGSSRIADSNSSVREFKAACEKALREQQEQIARVAELCEKLAQPQITQNIPQIVTPNITNVGQNIGPTVSPQVAQTFNCMSQNTNQYLNSDFNENVKCAKQNFGQNVSQVNRVNRRMSPCTSDITSSSCSSRNIKMRDKHRVIHAYRKSPVSPKPIDKRQLKVIQAHRVDIAPMGQETKYLADDNIAHCSDPSDVGSANDAFDLDNPLHLYAQAKRLQTLQASSQRSNSNRSPHKHRDKSDNKSIDMCEDKSKDKSSSVCALCRGYWRIIRQFFRQPFET